MTETDFDVDEAADALGAFENADEDAAHALASARGRIRARHWPPGEEEDSLSAATAAVRAGEAALTTARAELRGAAVAAVTCGVSKTEVARMTGVSRMTLDTWLKPRKV